MKNASIPIDELKRLVYNIREALDKPHNPAAVFLGRTSLNTLEGYLVENDSVMAGGLEAILKNCSCQHGGFDGAGTVPQPCDICDAARAELEKIRRST